MESSSLQELEQIPGVGKTIARDMQAKATEAATKLLTKIVGYYYVKST